MTIRSRRTLAILLTLLACPTWAPADIPSVQTAVDKILSRPVFSNGIHACVIKTLDTSAVVYSKNPNTLLNTASNMKLVTSAAALDQLGPGFRYRTRLLAAVPIGPDGVLRGNLYIAGSGDPTFDTPALQDLARQAAQRGLKAVEGAVIADTGNFNTTPYGGGWSWDYLEAYYAAPVGGLNLNKNVVALSARPGSSVGAPATVVIEPASNYMRAISAVTTAKAGTPLSLNIDRELTGRVVRVSGAVAIDEKVDKPQEAVAVYDPARYTSEVLRALLMADGIKVSGGVGAERAPENAILLGQHLSDPMSDILMSLNKWSDNLIAEALLRTLGSVIKNDGSIQSGRAVVAEVLKQAGADTNALSMADGSGLSRMDLMTAENFTRLLSYMYRHNYFKYYDQSLPVAGVDGTLRNRMKKTPAENNVHAKTGYIGYVSSLSGYVTTAAGQPLVFSILFNNQLGGTAPCRQAQDEIAAYLAGLTERL
ncbi:MAG: D-alanyl-D-alanine carboxypeptidase/D-alanyl-D-alanine-endopeptidase [Armatimonadetes bacterium]|nr:D-alanyl-D-alanine carboxypeptidase/D-alanyl-D-alanine-endopeptidase [Armatimonadota bacterium]